MAPTIQTLHGSVKIHYQRATCYLQRIKTHRLRALTTLPPPRAPTSSGDECVLAKGRRAIRNTEVRIACSPDERMHLLVREPDFCSYIFVLYVPALCELPEFYPVPIKS